MTALLAPDDYPAILCAELARHRSNGRPFTLAWGYATSDYAPPEGWGCVCGGHANGTLTEMVNHKPGCMFGFVRRHFEAAYHNDQTSHGRVRVPRTDTSRAARRVQRATITTGKGKCRSGGGCPESATHGRFGPTFCEDHAAELARLSIKWWGTAGALA